MTHAPLKKILLIGGLGVIGQILADALAEQYELIIADKHESPQESRHDYIQLDITEYSQLVDKIPRDIDTIVNLVAMMEQPEIVDEDTIVAMTDLYVKGAYNVFLAATQLGICRVIFTSSNHVTDYYEKDGKSLLGREISVEDYPLSRSVYGALKLAGESLGHVISTQTNVSVICLRVGTIRLDEREALQRYPRFRRTLLSKVDIVNLFKCAIETDIKFGIYYGVSDNPGRPWSISNAIQDLQFMPLVSSKDIYYIGEIVNHELDNHS